jgi:anti-sigma regulatory factor (Ser/Thr protein kinase)
VWVAAVGSRLTGFRCPFRCVPWLDVYRRVERASRCVRPAARVISRGRAAGKAGALMAGLAVRESVTLAGRAERARAARTFVSEVLGLGHPCGDVAVLLVSEIFSNSVRHSGSAAAGETVTVAVRAGDGVVRVEVTDRAGPGTPELRAAGGDAEGGRGLQLVAALAARWGWRRRGGRMVTRQYCGTDEPSIAWQLDLVLVARPRPAWLGGVAWATRAGSVA